MTYQKFYIEKSSYINHIFDSYTYPNTTVTMKDNNGGIITVFKNIRFERFDTLTWFIVHVYDKQCLSRNFNDKLIWSDCYKKNRFPRFNSQSWDIENWE